MSRRQVFKEGQQIREYKIIRYISQGSYGQIYEAVSIKDGSSRRLALKALYQQQFREHPKLLELYQNEVSLLKKLKGHANICEYIDNFEDIKFKYLIMEFCNGGDLIQELKKRRIFKEEEAVQYMSEILEAFKAFHQQDKHIIHRDIKLDNIFMHNGVCKLGDFGFAREVPKGKDLAQTWCGSLLTMAPEVIEGKNGYGISADIYSLGAILYQSVFGDFPYKCYNENETQLLKDIKNRKMDLKKNGVVISEDLKQLLIQMLTFNPSQRITFEELYNHKFFNKSGKKREYFTGNNDLANQKSNVPEDAGMNTILEEEEIQVNVNIKMVGSISVGKSSICNAYINGHMDKGDTVATMGVSIFKKNVVYNQENIVLNLHDTAGLEKHNSLPNSYYKQSDGYVLVFDMSDMSSLNSLDKWVADIRKNDQNDFDDGVIGYENILVVGNKSDLAGDILNSQEYKDKKRQLSEQNIKVLEVSAKTKDNLNGIFQTLFKGIIPLKKKNISNMIQVTNQQRKNEQNQGYSNAKYNNPSIKANQLSAGASNLREYNAKMDKKKKSGCC